MTSLSIFTIFSSNKQASWVKKVQEKAVEVSWIIKEQPII